MRIVLLGGTSQIAKDLILQFSKKSEIELLIYSRDHLFMNKWLEIYGENYKSLNIQEFNVSQKFDVLINCIGSSNQAENFLLSKNFFEVTQKYDLLSIECLKKNPGAKYIFLSSGVVFGNDFSEPVTNSTCAQVKINSTNDMSWYGISKLISECQHRSLADLSIIDLRIFSYFSHLQNIETKFLMAEVINSLKNNKKLLVSSHDITRDYITPTDFFGLVEKVIQNKSLNIAYDCYSSGPVNKFILLENLSLAYGLKYEVDEKFDKLDHKNLKLNYYSLNKNAEQIGYQPQFSSLTGIFEELNKLRL